MQEIDNPLEVKNNNKESSSTEDFEYVGKLILFLKIFVY